MDEYDSKICSIWHARRAQEDRKISWAMSACRFTVTKVDGLHAGECQGRVR